MTAESGKAFVRYYRSLVRYYRYQCCQVLQRYHYCQVLQIQLLSGITGTIIVKYYRYYCCQVLQVPLLSSITDTIAVRYYRYHCCQVLQILLLSTLYFSPPPASETLNLNIEMFYKSSWLFFVYGTSAYHCFRGIRCMWLMTPLQSFMWRKVSSNRGKWSKISSHRA